MCVPDLQSSGDLFGEVDGSQENTRADVVNEVLSKVSDAPNTSSHSIYSFSVLLFTRVVNVMLLILFLALEYCHLGQIT